MDYEGVREAVKRKMRAQGLNRSELAKRADIDRSLVTKLLSGKPWTMRAENLGKIEAELGMNPGEIDEIARGDAPATPAPPADLGETLQRIESLLLELVELVRGGVE